MPRTEGSKTRSFPVHKLEDALVVIQAIVESGASQPMDRLLVAQAIGRTPSSSEFKRILSSSLRYGLTTGTEKADYIEPTELGLSIAKPQNSTERLRALVEAALKPDVMGRILRHFNRSKFPEPTFLKNTLERSFDVEHSHSEELAELLVANATFAAFCETYPGRPTS